MCELMGMSFAEPISADFSIRPFALRAEENADGWGLAWYPDRSVSVVKEPLSWRQSPYARFLETYGGLDSRIYLGHVRKKTTGGEPNHADTHPFVRELGGRDYCFAHNGTIAEAFDELPLGRFRPVGDTDSEHLFCHLLACIEADNHTLDSVESWQWLYEKLRTLNGSGQLNCLLSDGRWLFAYHDVQRWKGLWLRKVSIHEGHVRHLEDPMIHVDLESKSGNHGLVIATRCLGGTGWHPFTAGELIVIGGGRIHFSSHRAIRKPTVLPSSARPRQPVESRANA